MDPKNEAKVYLKETLTYLVTLLKKVNGWENGDFKNRSLLPDVTIDSVNNFKNLIDNDFLSLVKDDFSNVHGKKGTIEFKALAQLIANTPQEAELETDPNTPKKHSPIKLLQYPPKGAQNIGWGWSIDFLMDLAAFSFEYDFESDNEYYLFKLNNANVALDIKSANPQKQDKLERIFTTPFLPMTIEFKIPRSLDINISFPNINFKLIGLSIDFDPNFPSNLFDFLNFKPLHLALPDWLDWPFGPLDFGSLFNFEGGIDWSFGLIMPDSGKFNLPSFNLPDLNLPQIAARLKKIFLKIFSLFGFSWNGSPSNYFTYTTPPKEIPKIPEWAAIYFDLTKTCKKILGGLAPKQLHLVLGFDSGNGQVKAGFLVSTEPISAFDNKQLLLQAAAYYDFDKKTDPFKIESHPGFSIEVLKDATLGSMVECPNPAEAKLDFTNFSVEADKIGVKYEKTEKTYAFYIDGKVTLKDFLKNADESSTDTDLKLPFKGLGITTDGKLVLKKTWIPLEKAQQVKIDDVKQIALFLKGYGYGKENDIFWIGFSGDIKLPVLNASAGVDRLKIKSKGAPELSGVKIDLDIAKILTMAGSAAWGEGLNAPLTTDARGFAGKLALSIPIIKLPKIALSFTYVKCTVESEKLIAWSFYGQVPVRIPLCCGLGINSLGMMVGQNYLPTPKKNGIPRERWLDQGFDGNTENILDTTKYWTISPCSDIALFTVFTA